MNKLMPFQEEVLPLMASRNFLLADDCGLGKTITAVEFGKRHAQGPILVICPRLVKEWWKQTIEEQEAGYVGVCERAGRGIPWNRVAAWGDREPRIWVIVHPEAVRIIGKQLERIKWDLIIVDEAHRFKNRKAQQTKALWRVTARRKIMMTATPYGRSPADLWAQLHYLYPKKFTSYWRFYDRFVESYRPQNKNFRVFKGPKNLEEMARLIAPFYKKREKAEVLELPELTYTSVPVMMNGKQEKLYMQLVKEAYAELVGHEVILENALVKFLRLHQCALDPALLLNTEAMEKTGVEGPLKELPVKVEWLQDWLEDHPGEPVVIVSRYRRFVERWLRGIAPEATIVGGMRPVAVQKALVEFNRTGVLVGTLDAVKEGLNLQRSSTMIVMDGSWSPIAEYQLAQRIHRMGSTRHCQVIHLVAKLATSRKYTVDKLMRQAVEQRMSDAALVDAFIKQLQEGK